MRTQETNAINKQLYYYLLTRSIEGVWHKFKELATIADEKKAFPFIYVIVWGLVMFLFELKKEILNRSMVTSMNFIYKDSDKEVESWTDLVPYATEIKSLLS